MVVHAEQSRNDGCEDEKLSAGAHNRSCVVATTLLHCARASTEYF